MMRGGRCGVDRTRIGKPARNTGPDMMAGGNSGAILRCKAANLVCRARAGIKPGH